MLRPNLVKSVLDSLDKHRYLSREDFIVSEYRNKDGEPCLSLKYRYDDSFFFNFHIPSVRRPKSLDHSDERYWFNCSMRPGHEAVEESLNVDGRDGVTSAIKEWVVRLYEDTVSAPAIRQFEEHAAAIDRIKERLRALPDEPLSREDVTAFNEGLDKLKTELTEQLKRETEDKDELKRRVDELSKDIQFLKQALESLPKRSWGELFVTRVQKWKAHFSLRQLSAGVKVLKLLLPADTAETLDVVTNTIDGIAEAIEPVPKSSKPAKSE